MGIFRPPNVEKMKSKKDFKGLVKALDYQKDSKVHEGAVKALDQISTIRNSAVNDVLIKVLLNDPEWAVRGAAANVIIGVHWESVRKRLTRLGTIQLLNALGRSKVFDKLLLTILLHADLMILGDEAGIEARKLVHNHFVQIHDRSDIDSLIKMVTDGRFLFETVPICVSKEKKRFHLIN